jgi:hypothetical protein
MRREVEGCERGLRASPLAPGGSGRPLRPWDERARLGVVSIVDRLPGEVRGEVNVASGGSWWIVDGD